jgi:hypothetical protein
MDELLSQASSVDRENTPVFVKRNGPTEVARITSSYAGRLGAERVKLTSCGPYTWVRFSFDGQHSDLLFRHPAQFQQEARPRGMEGDKGEGFRMKAVI